MYLFSPSHHLHRALPLPPHRPRPLSVFPSNRSLTVPTKNLSSSVMKPVALCTKPILFSSPSSAPCQYRPHFSPRVDSMRRLVPLQSFSTKKMPRRSTSAGLLRHCQKAPLLGYHANCRSRPSACEVGAPLFEFTSLCAMSANILALVCFLARTRVVMLCTMRLFVCSCLLPCAKTRCCVARHALI